MSNLLWLAHDRLNLNLNTMTHITLRQMPSGMHGSSQQLVAGFAQTQRISLTQLAEEISAECTLTPADIVGCIEALTSAIARHVSRGHSVSLGHLGTVSATLKVVDEPLLSQRTELSTKSHLPRVKAVHLRRISFRPSSLLRQKTEEALQRIVVRPQRIIVQSSPNTSPSERLALLQRYLRRWSIISVRQYAKLVGISRYLASKELHRWHHEVGNHIGVAGQGTHRMTVWEEGDMPSNV